MPLATLATASCDLLQRTSRGGLRHDFGHDNEAFDASAELAAPPRSAPSEEMFVRSRLYWRDLGYAAAEKLLGELRDGTFLLRPTSAAHALAMSVRWADVVYHFLIRCEAGCFCFTPDGSIRKRDLNEFMAKAVGKSLKGKLVFTDADGKKRQLRLYFPRYRRAVANLYC